MCILCVASRWSRRIVTMLPWLIIPFVVYWALSQLLPPSFRFEVTSPRLACLGVLLFSLGWYEILMPRLSQWRSRRNQLIRERRRIEAQEAAKWRKEAVRRCRNCLTAYRDQNPAGGRFTCTYCGHVSKRPALDVPGAVQTMPSSGFGQVFIGKDVKVAIGRAWSEKAASNSLWSGRSLFWNGSFWGEKAGTAPASDNCVFWGPHSAVFLLLARCISLVVISIGWTLGKLWNMGRPDDDISGGIHRGAQRKGDDGSGTHESRWEKARRKAEEKRQARLEKEQREAEERRQREEVARLVEERRRLRDEKLEAERRSGLEATAEREREAKKEKEAERRRYARDKGVDNFKEKTKDNDFDDSKKHSDRKDINGKEEQKCKLPGNVEVKKDAKVKANIGEPSVKTNDLVRGAIVNVKGSNMKGSPSFKGISSSKHSSASLWGRVSTSPSSKLLAPSSAILPLKSGTLVTPTKGPSAWNRTWSKVWGKTPKSNSYSNDEKVDSIDVGNTTTEILEEQEHLQESPEGIIGKSTPTAAVVENGFDQEMHVESETSARKELPSLCPFDMLPAFSSSILLQPSLPLPSNRTQLPSSSSTPYPIAFASSVVSSNNSIDSSAALHDFPIVNDLPPVVTSRVFSPTAPNSQGIYEQHKPHWMSQPISYSDNLFAKGNWQMWGTPQVSMPSPVLQPMEVENTSSLFSSREIVGNPRGSIGDMLSNPSSKSNNLWSNQFAFESARRIWEDSDNAMQIPLEFVDCITQEIMHDPVIAADGHSYERAAIECWLKTHDTSPKTGEVLPPLPGGHVIGVDKSLRPNHNLRGQIIEYKESLARGVGPSDAKESHWLPNKALRKPNIGGLYSAPNLGSVWAYDISRV